MLWWKIMHSPDAIKIDNKGKIFFLSLIHPVFHFSFPLSFACFVSVLLFNNPFIIQIMNLLIPVNSSLGPEDPYLYL